MIVWWKQSGFWILGIMLVGNYCRQCSIVTSGRGQLQKQCWTIDSCPVLASEFRGVFCRKTVYWGESFEVGRRERRVLEPQLKGGEEEECWSLVLWILCSCSFLCEAFVSGCLCLSHDRESNLGSSSFAVTTSSTTPTNNTFYTFVLIAPTLEFFWNHSCFALQNLSL